MQVARAKATPVVVLRASFSGRCLGAIVVFKAGKVAKTRISHSPSSNRFRPGDTFR